MAIELDASQQLWLEVEGARRRVPSLIEGAAVRFELSEPGPFERDYQVDGTDLTSGQDRDRRHLMTIWTTPFYRLQAWLRDEGSYSRWEVVRLMDPDSGELIAEGRAAIQGFRGPLPQTFRLEAGLRRPEAPAALWLTSEDGRIRQGVRLARDRREARWMVAVSGQEREMPGAVSYYPEGWLPFGASVAQMVGRSAMAGIALFVGVGSALAVSTGLARRLLPRAPPALTSSRARWFVVSACLAWLAAASWITVVLYRQLPHVLDAVSYQFQAGVFRAGRLYLDAPPLVDALKGPFQVVHEGRWFSQYPPGAPAAFALGDLFGLAWLVGPMCGLAMVLACASAARDLYGSARVGWLVLGLGLISPLILSQAGSFLSHPVAGALLGGALAAFARAERTGRVWWTAAAGGLIGAAFTVRETPALIYGSLLFVWLGLHERWNAARLLVLAAAPFGLLYLAYNQALTGAFWRLPRILFASSDRLGFGDGLGFYGRHTLAAGLSNADEQLTLLQFDLFGWPWPFALGLVLLPFVLGRANRGDLLLAAGALGFQAAFVAYFYHGNALGPRYLYEALPLLLLLAGRGGQEAARSIAVILRRPATARAGVLLAMGLLTLSSAAYYLPRQVERRTAYVAFPDGSKLEMPWLRPGLVAPTIADDVPSPAIVLVHDWWVFNAVVSPLNCKRLDLAVDTASCPRLFVLATTKPDEERLLAAYPGRVALRAAIQKGWLLLNPAGGG